jgi:hypothetical protein
MIPWLSVLNNILPPSVYACHNITALCSITNTYWAIYYHPQPTAAIMLSPMLNDDTVMSNKYHHHRPTQFFITLPSTRRRVFSEQYKGTRAYACIFWRYYSVLWPGCEGLLIININIKLYPVSIRGGVWGPPGLQISTNWLPVVDSNYIMYLYLGDYFNTDVHCSDSKSVLYLECTVLFPKNYVLYILIYVGEGPVVGQHYLQPISIAPPWPCK